MGFFSRIGAGIKKAAAAVGNIFRPKAPTPPPAPPAPAASPEIPAYISAEMDALRKATEILIQSEEHRADATWEEARNKALLYINKSQRLADKGKTQSGNRRTIAERYAGDLLSTPGGVEERKRSRLEVFNSNFGFDLSQEQAQTVGELMKSESFQKLMETYKERYDILIGMVGEQIEDGIDPVRIEMALNFWQENNLEPDFSDFAKVTEMPADAFLAMTMEVSEYREEVVHFDPIEDTAAVYAIMGAYITW